MSVVQVCFTVPDIGEAVSFFKNKLGKVVKVEELVAPFPASGELVSAQIGVPNAEIELAFLRVGGTLFELTTYHQPSTDDEEVQAYYAPFTIIPGIAVPDLEEAKRILEECNVRFVSAINEVPEASIPLFNAKKWVRFYALGGAQLELVESL